MRISNAVSFLTLCTERDSISSSVRVERGLKAVIKNWRRGSRVSPMWGINKLSSERSKRTTFAGRSKLAFFGPVNPSSLFDEIKLSSDQGVSAAWVTLGLFNVVVHLTDTENLEHELAEWAKRKGVAYELWCVQDSKIIETRCWAPSHTCDQTLIQRLGNLAERQFPNSVNLHVQEFATLMASSVCRAADSTPILADEIARIGAQLLSRLDDWEKDPGSRADVVATIVNVNAALSRLSSQCFAGVSPIVATECHYWLHSLLGVGTANIALSNVVRFIAEKLGYAKLPERFAALHFETTKLPESYADAISATFLEIDHLSQCTVRDSDIDKPLPLITYFSGRDGYSSQLLTLSAPLNAIGQTNSHHSNVLTVTHEISHVFVEGILAYIYPNPDDNDAVYNELKSHLNTLPFSSKRHIAAYLLTKAVVGMEQNRVGRELNVKQINTSELRSAFFNHRKEVKEIIVHVFDYKYFFSDNPNLYVKTIWLTWCSIPGIADRVPEYVQRTLCAISPNYISNDAKARREAVRAIVENELEAVASDPLVDNNYAKIGLEYLRSNWDIWERGSLKFEYEIRMSLVRLALGFMHSEHARASLFADPKAAHRKMKRELDRDEIVNPIPFVKQHLEPSPDPADALWLLLQLAYCVAGEA